MATEADHIALANHNHDVMVALVAAGIADWSATVAFDKAVHRVEAVFAAHARTHSTIHDSRETRLKKHPYKVIFKPSSHLLGASRTARYLADRHGQSYRTFTDFMSLERVRQLIRTQLRGVEQSALFFLSDEGRHSLRTTAPDRAFA